MSDIILDPTVPIPENRESWPFREMKIGDSFKTSNPNVKSAAYMFSKRNQNYKFTTRKMKDGYRIWRIKAK